MSFYKPYDKKLGNENDGRAKKAIKDIVSLSKNLKIASGETDYSVDLVLYKQVGNIEAEVKKVWKGEKFPYDTVQVPIRKRKYNDGHTILVMFNEDCSHHLVMKMKDIVKCPVKAIKNIYSGNELEEFYQVPFSMVKYDGLYDIIGRKDLKK